MVSEQPEVQKKKYSLDPKTEDNKVVPAYINFEDFCQIDFGLK